MARPLNGLLQQLRKMAAAHVNRESTDGELIDCFVRSRDEAAFAALIERHGPMVLGVCARLLPNRQDAEDACQATFLVLARKAASIRKKRSLGSWLHGVARRIAINLKREYARRAARERVAETIVPKDPAADVSWREVQTLLDDELQRLPDRYRTPLILCYLECLTRDEAAKRLGLSIATLHGRLERARQRMRDGLTKRGLTLGAAMSAVAFGEVVAQAALPPIFVVSSTKAALAFSANPVPAGGVVAPRVLSLCQEVMKSMFRTKATCVTAAILCAGLFVALVGDFLSSLSFAQEAEAGAKASKNAAPTVKGESDEEFIRRISKDLRGIEPTPTEIHFFVTSKDAARRNKLIDLFIQERQAKNDGPEKRKQYADAVRAVQRIYAEKDLVELAKPMDMLEVRCRTAGEVLEVHWKAGETVKKGDLLLRLDDRAYKAQLAAAEATVDHSRALLIDAEATSKRTETLAKMQAGAVTALEIARHRAQEEQAKATLRLAEANRELAAINLGATKILAPVEGRLEKILVRQGDIVTSNQVLLTIFHAKKESK
jgi:RNA polymerase sigma factor (sigma-70 family)